MQTLPFIWYLSWNQIKISILSHLVCWQKHRINSCLDFVYYFLKSAMLHLHSSQHYFCFIVQVKDSLNHMTSFISLIKKGCAEFSVWTSTSFGELRPHLPSHFSLWKITIWLQSWICRQNFRRPPCWFLDLFLYIAFSAASDFSNLYFVFFFFFCRPIPWSSTWKSAEGSLHLLPH